MKTGDFIDLETFAVLDAFGSPRSVRIHPEIPQRR